MNVDQCEVSLTSSDQSAKGGEYIFHYLCALSCAVLQYPFVLLEMSRVRKRKAFHLNEKRKVK